MSSTDLRWNRWFTASEYAALAQRTGVPVATLETTLSNDYNLRRLKVDEIRSILRYLKEMGCRVSLGKNKAGLCEQVSRVIKQPRSFTRLPVGASRATAHTHQARPVSTSAPAPVRPSSTLGSIAAPVSHHRSALAPTITPVRSASDQQRDALMKKLHSNKDLPLPPKYNPVRWLAMMRFHAWQDRPTQLSFILDSTTLAMCRLLVDRGGVSTRVVVYLLTPDGKALHWRDSGLTLNVNHTELNPKAQLTSVKKYQRKNALILPQPLDISGIVTRQNTVRLSGQPYASGVAVAHLVEVRTMEKLLQHIKARPMITSMTPGLPDIGDDIIDVYKVTPLRCPLTLSRMMTPVRGLMCTHEACFDARAYLQCSHPAQVWHCPSCDKPLPYSELRVVKPMIDLIARFPNADEVFLGDDGRYTDKDPRPGEDREVSPEPAIDLDFMARLQQGPAPPVPIDAQGNPVRDEERNAPAGSSATNAIILD